MPNYYPRRVNPADSLLFDAAGHLVGLRSGTSGQEEIFGMSASKAAAVDSLVSGPWIPSSAYWTHCFAPFQGNGDAGLWDQSGMGNDGTLGTTLSKAEAWASLSSGFASTIDLAAGEDQSVFRFPVLPWDYAAGESLCFFWKGQITPEGSSMVFFGTSAFSSMQGFGFRVTATGKLDFFLSPGAAGAIFGNSTTAAPFVAGETHSVCVFIDGVARKYAVYVDGAEDLPLQTLGAGASIDCKTVNAVSLGTGNAGAGTTGIATKTQALAVLKRAAGVGLPTDLSSIARALHRNPARLVSTNVW